MQIELRLGEVLSLLAVFAVRLPDHPLTDKLQRLVDEEAKRADKQEPGDPQEQRAV